ncbi:MAG: hypothetical protein CNLJKLNK_00658 [Holosporales bacterium]
MALFHTSTVALMHKRIAYLSKRSQVLTENIARSDIPGELRKELKPFRELIKGQKLDSARNPITSSSLSLRVGESDIVTQRTEIERELEVLEMNHNVLNHQSILDILTGMQKIYENAINPRV